MQNAQKPDHIGLNSLIQRLKDGRFVVPDFQREFEWEPWDIRDLMRSIFLDYYVGSLLLWRGTDHNYRALSCEPIYGRAAEGKPDHIVLDGQQRLTAINYAFCAPSAPLPHRKTRALYFIRVDRFASGDYENAFDYEWDWGNSTRLTLDVERGKQCPQFRMRKNACAARTKALTGALEDIDSPPGAAQKQPRAQTRHRPADDHRPRLAPPRHAFLSGD